jgi:hypothetical protein
MHGYVLVRHQEQTFQLAQLLPATQRCLRSLPERHSRLPAAIPIRRMPRYVVQVLMRARSLYVPDAINAQHASIPTSAPDFNLPPPRKSALQRADDSAATILEFGLRIEN